MCILTSRTQVRQSSQTANWHSSRSLAAGVCFLVFLEEKHLGSRWGGLGSSVTPSLARISCIFSVCLCPACCLLKVPVILDHKLPWWPHLALSLPERACLQTSYFLRFFGVITKEEGTILLMAGVVALKPLTSWGWPHLPNAAYMHGSMKGLKISRWVCQCTLSKRKRERNPITTTTENLWEYSLHWKPKGEKDLGV